MYVCTSTLGGKGVAEVCVHVYKCMALCAMCVCPLSTSNMHHINLYINDFQAKKMGLCDID